MAAPRIITHNGKTQSKAQWARELGIAQNTIDYRYNKGLPIDQVLSAEYQPGRPRHRMSASTMLRNKRDPECCVPDCEHCPLPDCTFGGAPLREETRKLKKALRPLPEAESCFEHVYRVPW